MQAGVDRSDEFDLAHHLLLENFPNSAHKAVLTHVEADGDLLGRSLRTIDQTITLL